MGWGRSGNGMRHPCATANSSARELRAALLFQAGYFSQVVDLHLMASIN
jgi:hypothetical protein